jgi:cobalt-zinc-cadmium efflux system membrane fusion protein
MTLTRKQAITIAGIVITGLIAALALLLSGRGDDHAHAEGEAAHGQPASTASAESVKTSQQAEEAPGLIELTPEQIRNANLDIRAAGRAASAARWNSPARSSSTKTAPRTWCRAWQALSNRCPPTLASV